MPQFRDASCAPRPVAELLAAAQWGSASRASREPLLDMRYAPDEDVLLDPPPRAIWSRVTRASVDSGAALATHYAVTDPYGAERGAPVLSSFFGCRILPEQVTFGAGVTSLLHGLSQLAGGGVVAPTLVHSDLEVWASARGARIQFFDDSLSPERIAAGVRGRRPAILHLDRPTFAGDVLPIEAIGAIADAAADAGTIVVVDEAPATYLGPRASVARLVGSVRNLVVVRGFTKAYSLGGMRAAFAVASLNVASHVRAVIAPLQVSELSLAVALRLLEEGDVFSRLLERIREIKPRAVALFQSAGFEPLDEHSDLPWIALRDDLGAASHRLEALGIRPLAPTTAIAFPSAYRANPVIRVTTPLSGARMDSLRELLAGSAVAAGVR